MHYDIKLYYFAATELLKYSNPKMSLVIGLYHLTKTAQIKGPDWLKTSQTEVSL